LIRSWLIFGIILLVLLVDQSLKIYVKTHFEYGETFPFTNWAELQFVENEGMAFGLSLGGFYGKLVLSLFRLVAVSVLFLYLKSLLSRRAPLGLMICVAFILAGALGNILDSMFYGLIFSESKMSGGLSNFVSFSHGYAPFLFGKVVDMLHFPFFDYTFPETSPIFAGRNFSFFDYIFNVADASVFTGVFGILFFQKRFLKENKIENQTSEP
jgi:signal peptidase II